MKTTEEITALKESVRVVRKNVRISYDEWNMLLFEVGCLFLEKHYGKMWAWMAKHTNFFDLWYWYWLRDDSLIKECMLHDIDNYEIYERYKKAWIDDEELFLYIDARMVDRVVKKSK